MEPHQISSGMTYASKRWKGDRKVTEVVRHRGQDAVVHFIDQRTSRTGNAPLQLFAASAQDTVHHIESPEQVHVTEGIAGTWYYHLSLVATNATALCGAKTMNTAIPLGTWGVRGHLNERWCDACAKHGAKALRAAGADEALVSAAEAAA